MPTASLILRLTVLCAFVSFSLADLCDGTLVVQTSASPSRFEAVRVLDGVPQSIVTLSTPATCGDIFTTVDSTFCCLNSNVTKLSCADLNGSPIWWDDWTVPTQVHASSLSSIYIDPSSNRIAFYHNSEARIVWGTLQVGEPLAVSVNAPFPLTAESPTTLGAFNSTFQLIAIAAFKKGFSSAMDVQYTGTSNDCPGSQPLQLGTHLAIASENLWSVNAETSEAYIYPQTILQTSSVCAPTAGPLPLPFSLSSAVSSYQGCKNIIVALKPSLLPPSSSEPTSTPAQPVAPSSASTGVAQVNCNSTSCEVQTIYTSTVKSIAWTKGTSFRLANVSDSVCPPPAPGPTFACVNGVWTSRGSVNTTTITIPGSTVVSGNLTVTGSTTIYGLQSTINVTNCASLNGSVTIILSQSDLEEIKGKGTLKGTTQLALITSGACSNGAGFSDLNGLGSVNGKNCAKVSVKLQQNSASTLSALIEVDTTRCNLWWIILLSVIAVCILIAVIVLAIIFTFHEGCRYTVRPFSKPRAA